MDLAYCKIVWLLNSWLVVRSAPVAMLQHATSSQSIVFHQPQASTPSSISNSSPLEQYGGGGQPKYEYKYEVSDHQTGDRKSHWESREGDTVRGVYTVYEPDGALRTVEYTADALHGFNAVVRRDEPNKHQHRRPQPPYSSANSVHDGYDASASNQRYSSERSSYNSHEYDRHSGGAPYAPTVGFSVNHVVGLKKAGDNFIKPY